MNGLMNVMRLNEPFLASGRFNLFCKTSDQIVSCNKIHKIVETRKMADSGSLMYIEAILRAILGKLSDNLERSHILLMKKEGLMNINEVAYCLRLAFVMEEKGRSSGPGQRGLNELGEGGSSSLIFIKGALSSLRAFQRR